MIAAHGRHYLVEGGKNTSCLCVPRAKKSEVVCGDRVSYQPSGPRQGVIEAVLPRRNLFRRASVQREKRIAANVDQLVFVVATRPVFSVSLLYRCLIAAEAEGMGALVLLNKCDVQEGLPVARERLQGVDRLGYPLIEICALDAAHAGFEGLHARLSGHKNVLVGQSGMGKSTLLNALYPAADARTREISSALNSGKHTTTHATLYRLDDTATLIDTPGLQTFGLAHIGPESLAEYFPEFAAYLGRCRYRDCRHDAESGCALHSAVSAGDIGEDRLGLYRELVREATPRVPY